MRANTTPVFTVAFAAVVAASSLGPENLDSKIRNRRPEIADLGTPPWSTPNTSQPLVFFHDRKTGGSTLRQQLFEGANKAGLPHFVAGMHFDASPVTYDTHIRAIVRPAGRGRRKDAEGKRLRMPSNPPTGHKRAQVKDTFEQAAVIAGHFSFGIAQYLGDTGRQGFSCLTTVREPMSRLISYYYERMYATVGERRPLRLLGPSVAESLFQTARRGTDEGALNTTLKVLCGVSIAGSNGGSLAIEGSGGNKGGVGVLMEQTPPPPSTAHCSVDAAAVRLDHCLVGVVERWEESCAMLNAYLPWLGMDCSAVRHEHHGKPRHETPSELPGPLRTALERLAATDTTLYHRGVQRFEELQRRRRGHRAF